MMLKRLSPREYLAIACVGVFGSIIGLYVLYDRALTERHANIEQLQKADAIHAVLLRLPETIADEAEDDLPLARRLTETATTHEIPINRLDPQGAAIAVSISDVAFSQLLSWAESVSSSGAAVRSADIGRRPEPGIVSANIIWEARQ